MASEEQVEAVRAEIGDEDSSGLSDADVEDLIDRLGSAEAAALRVLKQRHSNMLNSPASFSVTGYSENNVEIIKTLESKIVALAATQPDAVSADVSTINAYRPDRCGR